MINIKRITSFIFLSSLLLLWSCQPIENVEKRKSLVAQKIKLEINNVYPESGPSSGGTLIQLRGSGFTNGMTVKLGNTNCINVTIVDSSNARCTTPAATNGPVNISIFSSEDLGEVKRDLFTYQGAPIVNNVIDAVEGDQAGPDLGGTRIRLTGDRFSRGMEIKLGGSVCNNVQFITNKKIECTTTAHASGVVNILVTNADGQNSTTNNAFTYQATPVISGITPTGGAILGSFTITINGSNFQNGAIVKFNSSTCLATSYVGVPNSIQCTNVPGGVGAGIVTVTNPDGFSYVLQNIFSWQNAPTITSIYPDGGPTGGGNLLTINGSGFFATPTVKIGANNCNSVTLISSTTLTCLAPSSLSLGSYNVEVKNSDDQLFTLNNSYTYRSAPIITTVMNPTLNNLAVSSIQGNQNITITGQNFSTGMTVSLGNIDCPVQSIDTVSNPNVIICKTPAHAIGGVILQLTTLGGQSVIWGNQFTYNAVPVITSISPRVGALNGGTTITITGQNFEFSSSVKVGALVCDSFVYVNSSEIKCNTKGPQSGQLDVEVTNSDGLRGVLPSGFRFRGAPTVSEILPNFGPVSGGNLIIIKGSNLFSDANVNLGNKICLELQFINENELRCKPQNQSVTGPVNVLVTNSLDGQNLSIVNGYNYVGILQVGQINPREFPLLGGQVNLTGDNFLTGVGLPEIYLGNNPFQLCKNVVVAGPLSLSCTIPPSMREIHLEPTSYISPSNFDIYTIVRGKTSLNELKLINFDSNKKIWWAELTSEVTDNPLLINEELELVQVGTGIGRSVTSSSVEVPTSNVFRKISMSSFNYMSLSNNDLGKWVRGKSTGNLGLLVAFNNTTREWWVRPKNLGADIFLNIENLMIDGTNVFSKMALTSVLGNPPSSNRFRKIIMDVNNYLAPVSSDIGLIAVGKSTNNKSFMLDYNNGSRTWWMYSFSDADDYTQAEDIYLIYKSVAKGIVSTVGNLNGPLNVNVSILDNQRFVFGDGITYFPKPIVSTITPLSSFASGGTDVTITGDNFRLGALVSIGGSNCLVTSITKTIIKCRTSLNGGGASDVVVTNVEGKFGTLVSGHNFIPQPTIVSILPNKGFLSGGTVIAVSGNNFIPGLSLNIDNAPCTNLTVISSTLLSCTTPVGIVPGQVISTITNPDTQFTQSTLFSYVSGPTLKSISPGGGNPSGGTILTINGLNFVNNGSDVTTFEAYIDNIVCPIIGSITANSFQCTAPAGTQGLRNVKVRNSDGQISEIPGGYRYHFAPVITSFSPSSAPITGGTLMTINGANFLNNISVTIGGQNCTNISLINSTQVTCLVPALGVGNYNIVLTNVDNQQVTSAGTVAYNLPPTFTSILPIKGNGQSPAQVTITGTNFNNVNQVLIGGINCGSLTLAPTVITCTPGQNLNGGTVSLQLLTNDGQSLFISGAYTYIRVPVINGITPTIGRTNPTNPSEVISVFGNNFSQNAIVSVGGVACTGVSFVNSSMLTCTIGAHAAGIVDVVVTNDSGVTNVTGSLVNGFTYEDIPIFVGINPVLPNKGPLGGLQTLTITGANFTSPMSVLIGTNPCLNVRSITSNSLVCDSPIGNDYGVVDVKIFKSNYPSTFSDLILGGYEYQRPPVISSVAPYYLKVAGGDTLTINGQNFDPGGVSIKINNASCVTSTFVNANQVTCLTPALTAGIYTLEITNNGDSQKGTLNNAVKVINPPILTSATPNIFPISGTLFSMTLTGNDLNYVVDMKINGVSEYNCPTKSINFINCQITPKVAGAYNLQVFDEANQSSNTIIIDHYGPPTFTSITPNQSGYGGIVASIVGDNFTTDSTVTVNGALCSALTYIDRNNITCNLPAPTSTGAKDIVVTNINGAQSSIFASAYTYLSNPTISSITPNSVLNKSLTLISLTGTGFLNTAVCRIGGVSSTSNTWTSSTEFSCRLPVTSLTANQPLEIFDAATNTVGSINISLIDQNTATMLLDSVDFNASTVDLVPDDYIYNQNFGSQVSDKEALFNFKNAINVNPNPVAYALCPFLSGSDASSFQITTNTCTSTSNNTCAVGVTLKAGSVLTAQLGAKTAKLTLRQVADYSCSGVESKVAKTPDIDINLTGTIDGIKLALDNSCGANCNTSPYDFSFEVVRQAYVFGVNTRFKKIFTLKNESNVNVTLATPTFTYSPARNTNVTGSACIIDFSNSVAQSFPFNSFIATELNSLIYPYNNTLDAENSCTPGLVLTPGGTCQVRVYVDSGLIGLAGGQNHCFTTGLQQLDITYRPTVQNLIDGTDIFKIELDYNLLAP